MKAAEWIDRVKAAHAWESDYRVAKELGLSKQTIGSYRGKISTMDEDTSVKVAHALAINPALILADQAMERAKNDEARSAWSAILERLGGMAAALALGVGLGACPPPADAAQSQTPAPASSRCILCKVRKPKKKGAIRRMAEALADLATPPRPYRLA